MGFKNSVYTVTAEEDCPLYNVDEEFEILDSALTVESEKPACLILVKAITESLDAPKTVQRITQRGIQRDKIECGGCTGKLWFELKQEKAFSTLQMNMLKIADKRAKMQHAEEFFIQLRKMKQFELLEDRDLRDLTSMLKRKEFGPDKILITEGVKGTRLYVILSGSVAIIKGDNEVLLEMGTGEIFGEMSLLSGEPATTSVHTRTDAIFATLNGKDLKFILNKYPVLQIFFYRLLVNRAQVNLLRAGKISSGMSGELVDINSVELFQLINAGGKSGKVDLVFSDGRAALLFNEGEIVYASYEELEGKEAVFALLAKSKGSFTYTTGLLKKDRKFEPLGGFMGLVMEGLRRIDEVDDE